MISRIAFKARLTALESLRTIWMINVSSEIRTRSEGVLERFYAMLVFRRLSGRQTDPIANLGNRAAIDLFGGESVVAGTAVGGKLFDGRLHKTSLTRTPRARRVFFIIIVLFFSCFFLFKGGVGGFFSFFLLFFLH